MNLEAIYFISQVIAAGALIASLVFVGIQVREARRQTAFAAEQTRLSNKIARADYSARILGNFQAATRILVEQPAVAMAFRKVVFDEGDLEPVERTQVFFYFNLVISTVADSFGARQEEMVGDQVFNGMTSTLRWYLEAPVFRKEWDRIVNLRIYDDAFIDHVSRHCLGAQGSQL